MSDRAFRFWLVVLVVLGALAFTLSAVNSAIELVQRWRTTG